VTGVAVGTARYRYHAELCGKVTISSAGVCGELTDHTDVVFDTGWSSLVK